MSRYATGRVRPVWILGLAAGLTMLCASTSWAYWLETQLGGVRLGDSAYVLLETPGYGTPDGIVIRSTQPAQGPATSESFDGRAGIGSTSTSEGPGGSGGGSAAGGPGMMGGASGPFGSGGSGGSGPPSGMMGPGMMGPGGRGGPRGSGGPSASGPAGMGMARGFFGASQPGTLNTQAAMGMMAAPSLGGGGGPPMPPSAGGMRGGSFGGMGSGMPGMPSAGGSSFFGAPGAGGAGAPGVGGGAGGLTGGGPGSGVSSFPDWALSVWFDLRENEMEWFYLRDPGDKTGEMVAVGFVVNKLDGKIVAISVAGPECDFARTAMWKPHEYVQLGDSFKQVHYRYGWPHDIETFDGSGDVSGGMTGSVSFNGIQNVFRRDCILWYHEIRGEKQSNIAFTLHGMFVTRIHIWIPEPV